MLNNASELQELRVPPNNRLEKLKGDRAGQFSIRINDQYRICFVWENGDAYDLRRALVLGIRDYVYKCGFSKVIIGLSGGIDSALTAALATQALGPENVHEIGRAHV